MQTKLEEELSKLQIDISKAETRFNLSKQQLQEAMGNYCKAIASHESPSVLKKLENSVDFRSTQLQGNVMFLDWHYEERNQVLELWRQSIPSLTDSERRQRIVAWIEKVKEARSTF